MDVSLSDYIKFQEFSGFSVRGIFYECLNLVDKIISNELHSGGKIAPFSVKPLMLIDKGSSKIVWR